MAQSQTVTLVATAVSTLTFVSQPSQVQVVIDVGAGPVYFSLDGSTPTVGGANLQVASALGDPVVVALSPPEQADGAPIGNLVVKLISAGTPTVTVTTP